MDGNVHQTTKKLKELNERELHFICTGELRSQPRVAKLGNQIKVGPRNKCLLATNFIIVES